MTTIATDGETMAGDTLVNGSGYRCGYTEKVKLLDDGRIVGCTGFLSDSFKFFEWMNDKALPEPVLDESFEALILCADGTVEYIGFKLVAQQYLSPMAIGSGGELALGAMLFGATPHEAVAIAMERDTRTGGDIIVLEISD